MARLITFSRRSFPKCFAQKSPSSSELFRHREQIKESEDRYRSVTETALCGILTVNEEGYIQYANPSIERMFGYSSGELIGRELDFLLPHKFRRLSRLSNLQPTRVKRILGRTFVIKGRKKNGKLFPVELSVARYESNGRTLFTAMLVDVADREAAQAQVRRYTSELEHAQDKMLSMMSALEAEVVERKSAEEKILQISEREQRRLGEELHDGLGQTLTGISFMTKLLAKQLESEGSEHGEQAAEISTFVNDAIARTRDLARGFYPIELEKYGLIFRVARSRRARAHPVRRRMPDLYRSGVVDAGFK